MSGIDAVIARARMGGEVGFAERKQFKLARRRAIEKLRRFALADPYFYVLEIIQAAIAGGAEYVDIGCGGGDITISWIGGVVREDELAQLFDFLFASKDRVDIAHVRSLALGVNALLLFEPEAVIVESGDGSPGGTARMVVRQGAEQVDVGRGEGRLTGTYVRATGLKRAKVGAETGRVGDDDGSLEYATIELRCLTAPVPLVFNGQSLFGWSKQRVPNLFGYKQVRSFDEGDLYGTIGLDPTGGEPSFQLLTHGVWVQSYQRELISKRRIGGVVCFDRLHKTVDHSGFVRDEVFEELWLRLLPYAEALTGGRAIESPRISGVDGLEFSPNELRMFLREHPRVVVLPATISPESKLGQAAQVMARNLDAELLRAESKHVPAIRALGGRELLLWQPALTREELDFYADPPRPLPAKPWLLPTITLEAVRVDKLLDELREVGSIPADEAARAELRAALGESGELQAALYTPAEPGRAAGGLLVEVTSTGRLLGARLFASAHPGRVVRVELPTASPMLMRTQQGAALTLVAERFAARSVPALREQDQRTLAGLGVGKIEPGSAAARVALQVLSRVTVVRLRSARPGRVAPGLSVSLLRPLAGFDPFTLPLLRTVSGKPISLRELVLLCDRTFGLVYGCVPEIPADLEGLDRDRILALDAGSEATLIGMLGEAGYVRVDARDVLAEHAGLKLRDVALGLRDYPDHPDFPLLVEGEPAALEALASADAATRAAWLSALIQGLRKRVLGEADEAGADPRELEEHRRQALRHLQWIACRSVAPRLLAAGGDMAAADDHGLIDLPLFLDLDGRAWALRQVLARLRGPEGLLVHYGHVLGGAELGALTAAAREVVREGLPESLAVSAFVHRLLLPLGRVRLAFDFDLDDIEAARNPMTAGVAFLVRESIAASWGTGVIGVPATRLPEYRIQLRVHGRGSIAALDEIAHVYGMVGSIEVDEGQWSDDSPERIMQELDQQAAALLEALIGKLAGFADDRRRHEAALRALLTYVGEQLTLVGDHYDLRTPLAGRILNLPLFELRGGQRSTLPMLVSLQRLLEIFRRHVADLRVADHRGALDWRALLVAETPGLVFDWLDAHLQPERVVLPASSAAGEAAGAELEATPTAVWEPRTPLSVEALLWNLEHWLERLRPDQRRSHRDRPLPPTRVWRSSEAMLGGAVLEGHDRRVDLNVEHPIVVDLLRRPRPEALAWVLLAIYAHLNAVCGPIVNEHEVGFQQAIAAGLAEGSLQVLQPVG